jgi:hypothetical protein
MMSREEEENELWNNKKKEEKRERGKMTKEASLVFLMPSLSQNIFFDSDIKKYIG